MAQLTVLERGGRSLSVSINKDAFSIGRGPHNDLVLNDEQVSVQHAEIRREDGHCVLYDAQSTNGTLVNGKRTTRATLADGDVIHCGRSQLIFADTASTQVSTTDLDTSFVKMPKQSRILSNIQKTAEDLNSALQQLKSSTPDLQGSSVQQEGLHGEFSRVKSNLILIEKAYRRLAALYDASKRLISGFDLKQRLNWLIDTSLDVMEAERGFVILKKPESDALEVVVARSIGGKDTQPQSLSMTVASRVAERGETFLTIDAPGEQHLNAAHSIIDYNIHSVMCVPLKVEDRILGAIYLDQRSATTRFTAEDLELFSALASQAAMAIENARLYERMLREEQIKLNLKRYFSPYIVDEIMKQGGELCLGGDVRTLSVLFCDIRNYTTISEKMPPDIVVAMLNEYFTELTAVIFNNNGTLDKYIGDEIMALFGMPLAQPDDATRSVKTAIEMIAAADALAEKWHREQKIPFIPGIGIATGPALAGNIGSPQQMQFTAIGDIVNVARRLTSKALPRQILIDTETNNRIHNCFATRRHGFTQVKGKSEAIEAYEVIYDV